MDKISILVPCCNVEQYVRQCLDSIKAQTYTNLEVICIDDGSKDSTGAIIDEYVAADSRFKVIHKPNSGYGDSMNKGLEMYTGDYLGIIESDDWIEPDMFETLLNTAKANNLDLVRCCWYEGPTGTETVNDQDFVKKNVVCCPLKNESVFLQQPSIWVSLYRKDLLEDGRKVRFLPTPGASYQDASFAFKAYAKSKRFMMLDKPLHHYRVNPNSSVSASTSKVCCVVDEWEEMLRWIVEDPELHTRFSQTALLPKICHGGMIWNYQRLSRTSLKLIFLRRASQFFRKAAENGVLNLYDYAKKDGRDILQVKDSPLDYHRNCVLRRLDILSKFEKNSHQARSTGRELISIVVTCYNTAKYIESCLISILQQDYRNIEIICVDDHSTDDTEVLVRHMMRKDKRIVWVCTEKNSGLSVSRNLGIKYCKGNYVMFVDGDDCLLPGAVSSLYESMTDADDVVVGGAKVNYEEGKNRYYSLLESDKRYYTMKNDMRFNAFSCIKKTLDIHVNAWAKLWRRSIIMKYDILFPAGLLYEDTSFFWKYLMMAPNIHVIKDSVYLYQRHLSGSIMSSTFMQKSGMGIHHIYILEDIFQYAKKHNKEIVLQHELSALYENYFWHAYTSSPPSDYEKVLEEMCHIINENAIDTSKHAVLQYVAKYNDISKADIFMNAFDGQLHTGNEVSPLVSKMSKKLKKYRMLTKVLSILSAVLLLLLIILLFSFMM